MMKLKSSFYAAAFMISALTFNQCKVPGTADQLHQEEKWTSAVDKLIQQLPKEKNEAKKAEMTYKIAENYAALKKYDLAAQWYENADKAKYSEAHPEVLLKLADAYKATCRYEDAAKKYNEYLTRVPNDKAALNGAKSCELAAEWEKKPTRYEVTNVVMLNTANEDAAPVYLNKKKYDQILFYSYREGTTGTAENEVLGQAFPDLFTATLDKNGKWSVPAVVGGDANTQYAEGAAAYDMKGKTMYFTRCDFAKKETKFCAIYSAKGDGKKLDGSMPVGGLGGDTVLIAQPALNADATKLYFVSDMPGGQGGKDIWVASYDKATKLFGNPVNLGPEINTPKDELFPYIHADGSLYFSSNGHIGIGGFDLFKAANKEGSFGPVVNLKVPLNSCGDDVAIVFEDKAERGYVTSNRVGTKGGLDIWSFVLRPLEVKCDGKVVENNASKTPVKGVKITVDGDPNLKEFISDTAGKFAFPLALNLNYRLKGTSDVKYTDGDIFRKGKSRYFSSKPLLISTIGIDESKTFECLLVLDTIPVRVELPNVEYPYNKWYLTPEAQIQLNSLIEIMNENPTFTIELSSHTDIRGGADYNRKLAQRRAESAVRYLIEKGIDAGRLKAKGYGEDKPKLITKENVRFVPKKYEAVFPIGTLLDEKFINSLKSKELQEAAHQLNRRTEFQVLCTEWSAGKNAECK